VVKPFLKQFLPGVFFLSSGPLAESESPLLFQVTEDGIQLDISGGVGRADFLPSVVSCRAGWPFFGRQYCILTFDRGLTTSFVSAESLFGRSSVRRVSPIRPDY